MTNRQKEFIERITKQTLFVHKTAADLQKKIAEFDCQHGGEENFDPECPVCQLDNLMIEVMKDTAEAGLVIERSLQQKEMKKS